MSVDMERGRFLSCGRNILNPGSFLYPLSSCCSDTGLCCDTIMCPWCVLGRLWAAVENRPDSMDAGKCLCAAAAWTGPVGTSILVNIAVPWFPLLLFCDSWVIWRFLVRIKKSWGIDRRHFLVECLYESCLCGCCTLIRLNKELRARGSNPGYVCCGAAEFDRKLEAEPVHIIPIKRIVPPSAYLHPVQPGYPGAAFPQLTIQGADDDKTEDLSGRNLSEKVRPASHSRTNLRDLILRSPRGASVASDGGSRGDNNEEQLDSFTPKRKQLSTEYFQLKKAILGSVTFLEHMWA